MEKLLKRVVSIVCAITMVLSGIVFTPSNVGAATTGTITDGQEHKVGAWGLFAWDDTNAGYSQIDYVSRGNELGDTDITLTKSPHGNYNSVSWLTYAHLSEYMTKDAKITTDKKAMTPDETYKVKLTMDISGNDKVIDEDKGHGIILVKVQGKKDILKVKINDSGDNKTFTSEETFDYDVLSEDTDVYLYLAGMNPGTKITIKDVKFEAAGNGWKPVPNWNPDEHKPTDKATYQNVGVFKALAMYGPKSGMWGKLKYKNSKETPTDISDTTVKVTSSGWVNNDAGTRSWAASLRFENYCDTAPHKLVTGEEYTGKLVVESNKPTVTDDHERPIEFMAVVDGQAITSTLNVGTNEITIPKFEYSGSADVDINLDGLQANTEIRVVSLSFTDESATGWTALPNEASEKVGAWELFARTCTGEGDDNSQWGALSYKDAPGVSEAKNMEDTIIKVRSSSGWHNAWATLATLHGYITKEPNKLKVGHRYYAKVKYYSNKDTKKDKYGKDKTLLLSVDTAQLTFPLKAVDNVDDYNSYNIATTDKFVYEQESYENDPTAVVLNMDQLEKKTELRIFSIEFIEDTDYEWTAIDNDGKFHKVGNSDMNVKSVFDDTTEQWSKMSYKLDKNGDPTKYSDFTIWNRSVSGWFVTNNPSAVIEFPDVHDDEGNALQPGYKYSGSITVEATRTDPKSISQDIMNKIKVIKDDDDMEKINPVTLNDEGDTVIPIDEFTYSGKTNANIRLILDMMTKDSTIKVKNVTLTHKAGEPKYKSVPNDTAVEAGQWWLYALTGQDGAWGEMKYNVENTGENLEDTEIYCWRTSGWFPGNAGMLASLPDYCAGKMEYGEYYSVAITIDSDKDIAGITKDDEGNEIQHDVRVTINDSNYDIEVYKGEHTYVIPKTAAAYDPTKSKDVVFDLDTAFEETKVKIKSISFGAPIETPKEIKEVIAKANSNKTIDVSWTQTPNTIYGTLTSVCGFNVYVDGKKQNNAVIKNNVNSFTTSEKFGAGTHKVKVVALLGSQASAGKTVDVTIQDTTTEAPTQKPTETVTQAPTQKPTVAPVTTKAPTTKETTKETTKKVKKPGKVKIKKAVKKKKSAKKIKVTLKKVKNAKGYQIAVYKNKKNAKKNKKALVKKLIKSVKATIKSKKLKGKKTVYVRARAYVLQGKKKKYGAWSKVKKSKKK